MTKRIDHLSTHVDRMQEMPVWAKELFTELKAIKLLLQQQQNKNPYDFYDFINKFRKKMQADVEQDRYPEVEVDERRIGVTKAGLLYDKATSEVIDRTKAFSIYKSLYKQHQRSRLF